MSFIIYPDGTVIRDPLSREDRLRATIADLKELMHRYALNIETIHLRREQLTERIDAMQMARLDAAVALRRAQNELEILTTDY